jgi:molecular chaperone HtpG
MAKKQFKAESKRLMELMIHSIYTNKEIFLRELISNASDAMDKMYYRALQDDALEFRREDYYIEIIPDKETRTITIRDTGIGMTREELDSNLGVIARSGSDQFKKDHETAEDYQIIGQFGVGFYSAFMVADRVTVNSRAFGQEEAYQWESSGIDGYTITKSEKESHGTDITLHLRESSDEEDTDRYLKDYEIRSLIKKYSDFIRYPIRMGDETINSMVPLWRKNKNELTREDYDNFYEENHFGFGKPLKHIHVSVDGAVSYNAILYIPSRVPYDYYTKEFQKGLELYSSGVMIMKRCPDLLPDHFGFVQGLVDSEDLSLNISREMLQNDRQLRLISKKIREKIHQELLQMLRVQREDYEEFFRNFGRTLKFGIYNEFGKEKEELQDLLLFYSSSEEKLVTLEEYISRMKEDQPFIYYASGETAERISRMPQVEKVLDKGFEVLYFTDEVDEFAIQMLWKYKDKEFRSVSSGDLKLDEEQEEKKDGSDEDQEMLAHLKKLLEGQVEDVRLTGRLKSHPVCLTAEGPLSIEMEKVLNSMADGEKMKARKILELNSSHPLLDKLRELYRSNRDQLDVYGRLLLGQALILEGLDLEDPIQFNQDILKLMME